MLKSETIEKLAGILGFATALEVARFDAVLSTKKLKKRHMRDGEVLINEVVRRLNHVGVTRATWDLFRACNDYEVRCVSSGCAPANQPDLAVMIAESSKDTLPEFHLGRVAGALLVYWDLNDDGIFSEYIGDFKFYIMIKSQVLASVWVQRIDESGNSSDIGQERVLAGRYTKAALVEILRELHAASKN